MEECFARLRQMGIQRAIILVANDNSRGRDFWLRSGWEELPGAMAMGKDVPAESQVKGQKSEVRPGRMMRFSAIAALRGSRPIGF